MLLARQPEESYVPGSWVPFEDKRRNPPFGAIQTRNQENIINNRKYEFKTCCSVPGHTVDPPDWC
jgi:hypothetical protein